MRLTPCSMKLKAAEGVHGDWNARACVLARRSSRQTIQVRECRCSIALCILQALAVSQAKIRAFVRSMKEHVGVENQQLLCRHRVVQRVAVVNID